jgi:hypothetical protein
MSEFLDAAQASPYIAPRATPPGDLYFTYTKPDGDTFTGPAANVENYLSLGYTVAGELTLSDSESFRDAVSPGTSEPPADGVSAEDPARPAEPETPTAA